MSAQRIQKLLASLGCYGSRRHIESQIVAGKITVAGKVAELGQRINVGDPVKVDGRLVDWSAVPEADATRLIYHKPVGEICTRADPQGRPTVFSALPHLPAGRWISVGRLDINSAGLLLFSNQGEDAHRLMHPRFNHVREYRVRVYGRLSSLATSMLLKGVMLDDGLAAFDTIEQLPSASGRNQWYLVTLHSGRHRLVRRLFAAVNTTVNQLIRTRYGDYRLPKDLNPGESRLLGD